METLLPLLVQLIGGALGGNAVGLLKKLDLSKIVATISGLIGGVAGGQLAGIMDLITKVFGEGAGGLAGHGAASAGGGALLTLIVGLIKKAMAKPA